METRPNETAEQWHPPRTLFYPEFYAHSLYFRKQWNPGYVRRAASQACAGSPSRNVQATERRDEDYILSVRQQDGGSSSHSSRILTAR